MPRDLYVIKTYLLDRTCAHCGHRWWCKEVVEKSAAADFGNDDEIARNLEQQCEDHYQQCKNVPIKDIVCPCCSHLAVEAVGEFFSEGYRNTLMRLFRQDGKDSSITVAIGGVGSLALVAVLFLYIASSDNVDDLEPAYLLGGASLFLLSFSLFVVHGFKRLRFNRYRPTVVKWLDEITEEEAVRVVVSIIRSNDDRWAPEISGALIKQVRISNQKPVESG